MRFLESRRSKLFVTISIVLVIAVAVIVTLRVMESRRDVIYPPQLWVYIPEIGGVSEDTGFISNWENPSAVAVADGRVFVLDTGRSRVIIMNEEGTVESILGETGPTRSLFRQPQGIAVLGDRLFIANTGAGEVNIVSLSGELEDTIQLPQGDDSSEEPRPTGIAVTEDGGFYVSDTANNVVLHYDKEGTLVKRLGVGDDEYVFQEPRGLTLDRFGSLYVADTLNGRVRKFSAEGKHVADILLLSAPEYSWPVDVAVGPDGTVYFSDRKRGIVNVFNQASTFMGIVGLWDASIIDSPSVLRDPHGLFMVENKLYIIDRVEGLFRFDIDSRYWVLPSQGTPISHGD